MVIKQSLEDYKHDINTYVSRIGYLIRFQNFNQSLHRDRRDRPSQLNSKQYNFTQSSYDILTICGFDDSVGPCWSLVLVWLNGEIR